jgi:hypothetical protein
MAVLGGWCTLGLALMMLANSGVLTGKLNAAS